MNVENSIIAKIYSPDVVNQFSRLRPFIQEHCGIKFDYWQSEKLSHRDEFFLVLYALLMLFEASKDGEIHEWRLKFDVAFLYYAKSIVEMFVVVDRAAKSNFYTVCHPLLRSLHSKLCLVILESFNPEVFDHWLKNQKDKRYIDGNIRKELLSHELYVYNHLYNLNSGVTHGMHDGMARVGYLAQKFGTYNEIMSELIYLSSKFLIGTYAYTQFVVMGIDLGTQKSSTYLVIEKVFNYILDEVLAANRVDNLQIMFPEEGYEVRLGNKYILAGGFPFEKYKELLVKNYRDFPRSIILSEAYRII